MGHPAIIEFLGTAEKQGYVFTLEPGYRLGVQTPGHGMSDRERDFICSEKGSLWEILVRQRRRVIPSSSDDVVSWEGFIFDVLTGEIMVEWPQGAIRVAQGVTISAPLDWLRRAWGRYCGRCQVVQGLSEGGALYASGRLHHALQEQRTHYLDMLAVLSQAAIVSEESHRHHVVTLEAEK